VGVALRKLLFCLFLLAAGSSSAWGATTRQQMIDDCDAKDADRAIRGCAALIASNTETQDGLIVTHAALAEAYFNKGSFARAVGEYDIAIDIDTDNYSIYRNLVRRGTAHNANCQLDAAIADDNRALAMKPNEAMPYFNRGLVYLRKGDVVRARADFAQAHRMKPDDYLPPDEAFALPRPPACPEAVPNRN
jgi:tetratricopeptide (TPR) repeat protein